MTVVTHSFTEQSNSGSRPVYQKIAIIALIMITICGSLTGIMSFANRNGSETFLNQWASAFIFAGLVALPIGIIVMGLVSKLIEKVLSGASALSQKLLTGVVMAVVMETAMAATSTINHIGFTDLNEFSIMWSHNFFAALPFGLIIAMLMALVIKPKLESFMKS
ncbi:DUF2798 domain-containing protein [Colwellia echini]|uniref:DUF2798 domain-containing protein n=1 Tax=Colwellia echini TaxID=1982103 RepID=A0ABY3MZU6_9GAMM|nr:DUF2798 domain-containing protein [Colwellia echini]TYK66739.1 DUF2798 domain-containing protein [Colwellia echini]